MRCSVFVPFSVLPFITSYTGAVSSVLHRTHVYLGKKKGLWNNGLRLRLIVLHR